MSWNPFKKKDADATDAGRATAPQAPAHAPAQSDDDDTKPIMEAGGVTERVSLIRESNGIRFEKVEVWGAGGLSDEFVRLLVRAGDRAAQISTGLLNLPETLTGFRDMLVCDGYALAAAFDEPEAILADLLAAGNDAQLPRPADVTGMLATLAAEFSKHNLAWLTPSVERIGLRRQGVELADGLRRWVPMFTAWDCLRDAGVSPAGDAAAALVRLFIPVISRVADQAQLIGFNLGEQQARQLANRLEVLAANPDLTYALIAGDLQTYQPGFTTSGLTDNGVKRDHNEDAWLSFQIDQASSIGAQFMLAVVADGMGGHASGEVASSLALDLLRQQLMLGLLAPRSQPLPTARLTEQLKSIIRAIDRALTERAELDEAMSGMGTTLAGVAVLRQATTMIAGGGWRLGEETAAVFHVGDSRVYRYGPDGLSRLTRDHSLVQDLLDSGTITADEAFSHPRKNVIMRCLGGGDSNGTPDVNLFTPGPGEILLIGSDGLSDALRDTEIAAVFRDHANAGLEQLADALVAAANAAGGPDNITVLLVSCADSHSPPVI